MDSLKRWKNDYSYLCGGWLRKLTDWVLKLWSALVGFVVIATSALQNTEATDRVGDSDDELGKKEELVKKMMDRLTHQLMWFNEYIQAKNRIISRLKEKLHVQKIDGKEDDHVNDVTVTKKNLHKIGRVDASEFEFIRILGTGGFASVFLVQKKGGADDGRLYAMKVLENNSAVQNDNIQCTITELRVLDAICNHPFLTTLHYVFQTEYYLCIVLDYMSGGDLYAVSHDRGIDEYDVRIYIGEIIMALEHLHKLGVMHRDVKLENILLDSGGHAVLSDYGLSRMFHPGEERKARTWCGTLLYMAPELIARSSAGYDMAVDWWSLGIVTYELLTGRSPFERPGNSDTDNNKMHQRIIAAEPRIPDNLSLDAVDFLSKLLVKNPEKRLGGGNDDAEELKKHPFLKGINWSDLAQRKIWAPFVHKRKKKRTDSNFTDDSNLINPAHIFDTLPSKYKETYRRISCESQRVRSSEHGKKHVTIQPTVESHPNLRDHFSFEWIPVTKIPETELNETQTVRMSPDNEKRRRKSLLRAAKENIESLEAELFQENCVQSRYNEGNGRPKADLKDVRERIMNLEVELNEPNCLREGRNRTNEMLQIDLRAAIKRIEALKMELIETNCMEEIQPGRIGRFKQTAELRQKAGSGLN
jgi:serine/threonine protein kinase